VLADLIDPESGEFIDRVIGINFKAPGSYTGQDMLEIHGHGGEKNILRILDIVLSSGARLAEPGEFSLRAFLNNKLSLNEAEAVGDLIDAETEVAANLARRRLSGTMDRDYEKIREKLISILMEVEASLDFPQDMEEAISPSYIDGWKKRTGDIIERTNQLIESCDWYEKIINGFEVVLVGPANTGKSTLFNKLVGEERALVHDEPGTTRDMIREKLVVSGYPVLLVDGAGWNEAPTDLEEKGRSLLIREFGKAFLAIIVIDGSNERQQGLNEILLNIKGLRKIVVVNKLDKGLVEQQEPAATLCRESNKIEISAIEGKGIDELKRAIVEAIKKIEPMNHAIALLRHRGALQELKDFLNRALMRFRYEESTDMAAEDLRSGAKIMDELTGRSYTEAMLEKIFSRFCIGK